jgi:acetyl esterase
VEPVANVAHRLISGPAGPLMTRVYTPAGSGPFPVLVYYHGGGWVLYNLDVYDASCRALANAAGAVVVSVAYRRAPEHQFPAAADDAFAAYRWALDSAAAINGDPARVAVGGESVGGNLAAVVSLMARDRHVKLPVHQLLIYPVVDFNFDTPSYHENANAPFFTRKTSQWAFDKYLRTRADGDNPYVSPLRADLKGLPPATVITSQLGVLRSEGKAYADKLTAAGVPTVYQNYDGVTHEFFSMSGALDQAKAAVQLAASRLKQSYGTP